MTENLTHQYKGYAVYLPSLQQGYANYATKTNAETTRDRKRIPKNFDTRWLNFLDQSSKLWHCGYTLYSCGQFETKNIPKRDIIAERLKSDGNIVVGDSGGFQLGTGAVKSKAELAHLERYKNDPVAQFDKWHDSGFRQRTLAWLERYTDYAMTLDMVIWAAESYEQPNAKKSQLRKLSVQQLIDLSVDNLRYFSNNRGLGSRTTKFLNVLQDIDDPKKGISGTGEAWYQAVKDFDFEGWALGSQTGGMFNSLWWLRRLLNEGKLEKSEWIHTLGKSPPVNSLVYTAAQRALRKALGREDFTISLDSSSPCQMAGKQRKLAVPPNFSSDRNTWKVKGWFVPMDIRLARNERQMAFPFATPLSKYLTVSDLMAHDIDDSDYFTDTWAEHLLVNHNIYTFHRYSIDACDLVFGDNKDLQRVPADLVEIVELIERYFEAETVGDIEVRLHELFEPYLRAGKDKGHGDSEDARDDSEDVETVVFS